jgi:hypothetical protein
MDKLEPRVALHGLPGTGFPNPSGINSSYCDAAMAAVSVIPDRGCFLLASRH